MSDELNTILQRRIAEAGGWLPFDQFMQSALYEPGLGYYESAQVFGEKGDFVTGAELGPWLALALGDLIAWGWERLGRPDQWCLLEQGGGTGELLLAVINNLQKRDIPLPTRVVAVEACAAMRQRQHEAYARSGVEVMQADSLDALKPQENCLMFCNELVDALPVKSFIYRGGEMFERGVIWNGEVFAWQAAEDTLRDGPAIDAAIREQWPDGYISEWNPNLDDWQTSVARVVGHGYLFCVDYGYAQSEYYRPQRIEGTLLAYAGHQASDHVLSNPGGQDITAHVDFTAMCSAGKRAGLHPCCWISQGAWLAQSPSVQRYVQGLAADPDAAGMQALAHAKRMMLPNGMGELFKLCIQTCGSDSEPPSYLESFDRVQALTRSPDRYM